MKHPAGLLDHVLCIDPKTGERFTFTLADPEAGWYWQRRVLDRWMGQPLSMVLKARQIGITWLAAGYALWKLLTMPGTRALVVSINEDEAIKVVNRLFDMVNSLPDHLRFGAEISKPTRGARPTTTIELTFPDGRLSTVVGLPSTRRAGHGETATIVLLDEYARHEYAQESWKALFPTADNGGQLIVISTANGISNEQTGEGNFFHHLWVNQESYGIDGQFLAWDLHPDRDEHWYATHARALRASASSTWRRSPGTRSTSPSPRRSVFASTSRRRAGGRRSTTPSTAGSGSMRGPMRVTTTRSAPMSRPGAASTTPAPT